jgi:hypothetical protein
MGVGSLASIEKLAPLSGPVTTFTTKLAHGSADSP